jgi:hypothetical protein
MDNAIFHSIKFYIDKDLIQGISSEYVIKCLKGYVTACNRILSKSTNRIFVYGSYESVESDFKCCDNVGSTYWTTSNYDIDIRIYKRGNVNVLAGAYATTDSQSRKSVIDYVVWDEMYDYDSIKDEPGSIVVGPGKEIVTPYWYQIFVIVHEFGHICGCGMGEYYSIRNIIDKFGRNCDANWFNRHPDILYDPMYRSSDPTKMQFGIYNSAIINSGKYRAGVNSVPICPSDRIIVKILNLEINSTEVYSTNITTTPPYKILYVEKYGYKPLSIVITTFDLEYAYLISEYFTIEVTLEKEEIIAPLTQSIVNPITQSVVTQSVVIPPPITQSVNTGSNVTLKPCHFNCCSYPLVIINRSIASKWVQCPKCGARGPKTSIEDSDNVVALKWNSLRRGTIEIRDGVFYIEPTEDYKTILVFTNSESVPYNLKVGNHTQVIKDKGIQVTKLFTEVD